MLGARQVLIADVALRDGSTVYERYGDTPILLIAAIALILGRLLDMTEPSAADRSPGAAAARANWRRLRYAGVSGGPAGGGSARGGPAGGGSASAGSAGGGPDAGGPAGVGPDGGGSAGVPGPEPWGQEPPSAT
jgi:hypothetical protein